MQTARQYIQHYQLQPHPEGGWYKETYRSNERIAAGALPERFGGARHFATAIYFLIEKGNFSAFHRIKSDECWHFYAGQTLEVFVLNHEGKMDIIRLGSNSTAGEIFQYVVPANCWFASRPSGGSAFSFVGCTVSPGFDFADFEMAKAAELISLYPEYAGIIAPLCR